MGRRFRRCFWLAVILLTGCFIRELRWSPLRPLRGATPRTYTLLTTGYCKCGACCGWKRTWYGRPVIASGPTRGRPKKVGYTASGTRARPGTIAADTRFFPFGTIVHVPGYGYGRVEDRGSDIKGYHIDLYFRSHEAADEWGRSSQDVRVWRSRN